MKTALQIAMDRPTKDRKAKEQARAEKLRSGRIRALQTAQMTTTKKKKKKKKIGPGWKMVQEKRLNTY